MKWEKEFLKFAGQMLRNRFHIYNGFTCIEGDIPGVQYSNKPIDEIMCYVGYADGIGEMKLILAEIRESFH